MLISYYNDHTETSSIVDLTTAHVTNDEATKSSLATNAFEKTSLVDVTTEIALNYDSTIQSSTESIFGKTSSSFVDFSTEKNDNNGSLIINTSTKTSTKSSLKTDELSTDNLNSVESSTLTSINSTIIDSTNSPTFLTPETKIETSTNEVITIISYTTLTNPISIATESIILTIHSQPPNEREDGSMSLITYLLLIILSLCTILVIIIIIYNIWKIKNQDQSYDMEKNITTFMVRPESSNNLCETKLYRYTMEMDAEHKLSLDDVMSQVKTVENDSSTKDAEEISLHSLVVYDV